MIKAEMDTVRYDLIKQNYPAGLTEAKVWGVFLCRYKCDAEGNVTGKIGKIPLRFNGTEIIRNRDGEPIGASSKDLTLLVSLDEAIARCEANEHLIGHDGNELSLIVPAWLITEDSEYAVIDGDNILDDAGDFKTEAIKRIFTDGSAGVSEYSISLTGAHRIIHIGDAAWTEGKDFSVDGEDFEVFARTRRWMTATGLLVEDAGLDPTIESYDQFEGLVACMRPAKRAPRVVVSSTPMPKSNNLELYIKQIKAQTRVNEGGRNDRLFNISGNIAKKVGNDFAQTLEIMRDLNLHVCDTPLDDNELQVLVRSSLTNGTARVDNAPTVLEFDMSAIANKVVEASGDREREAPVDEPEEEPELELERFDYKRFLEIEGLFGVYLNTLADHENDPKMPTLVAGAISYMSTLCAGNVEAIPSEDVGGGTYNAFIGVTASSGSGKDLIRKANDKLLKSLDLGYTKCGPIKLTSGAGIYRAMATPEYEHPISDDQELKIGQGGCKLFMCDEAGDIFDESRKTNQITAGICESLKVSLSSSGTTMFQPSSYADGSNNVTIEYLCPTVLFTTTPDRMYNRFPVELINDGFLGRLILIDQPHIKASRRRSINPTALPDSKLMSIKAFSEQFGGMMPPNMINYVDYDDDAVDLYLDYAYMIDKEIDNLTLHDVKGKYVTDIGFVRVWSRAMEKANRIVGLLAVSEANSFEGARVTKRLMQIAIDFALWNTYEMQEKIRNCMYADSESEALAKIIAKLKRYEKTVKADAKQIGKKDSELRSDLKLSKEDCTKALELGLNDGKLVRSKVDAKNKQPRYMTTEFAKQIGVKIDE